MLRGKIKKKKKFFNLRNRVIIMGSFILFLFFCIVGRLFYVQILGHEDLKKEYEKEKEKRSKRGRIITNDGEILAYDNEVYTITLDPTLIFSEKDEKKERDERIDKVLNILKESIPTLDTVKLKKEIIEAKNKNLPLKETVNNKEHKNIINKIDETFKSNKKSKSDRRIRVGGAITFKKKYERKYIKNDIFQELVGYLSSENRGYGIEKYYDEELTGIDGREKKYLRSSLKNLSVKTLKEDRVLLETKDGDNIILTLDSVLQNALDKEMKKVYTQYSAKASMGILLEVETGRILAMSSYPKTSNRGEIKNIPIADYFEPGSIFKPIIVAMGLESGVIDEFSTIYSEGSIKVADRVIKDHDNTSLGLLTLDRLIYRSGNVGMVKIAQKIVQKEGVEKFYNYLLDVGLNQKTGIDTYSELSSTGIKLKDLTEVKRANISFGQGISTTQLQILMALNTVINNGRLLKPYIVDRVEDSNGEVIKQNTPKEIRKVFSDEVSRINRKLMEGVVAHEMGTGKGVRIPGYRIGGKTGTAQKAGNRGYEKGKYYSSFFAFFPVEKPKYAILVTVDEPKEGYYGAAVALPPVKVVLEELIKYRGITPQGILDEKPREEFEVKPLEMKKSLGRIKKEFENGIMPEVIGLSMREFLSVYPMEKYKKYKINGNGKIIGQYPKAGSVLSKDTQIIVNFQQ